MAEIKGSMAEMKELMRGTAKTYAQAVSRNVTYTEATTGKTTTNSPRNRNQVTKEQQRTARRPYEVKLTNRHRHQKEFAEMHVKDVLKKLQKTIDGSNIEGKTPILQAGNKCSNGIRLQCNTEEDAQLLRKAEVNWSDVFQGQASTSQNTESSYTEFLKMKTTQMKTRNYQHVSRKKTQTSARRLYKLLLSDERSRRTTRKDTSP
jgi:hypothetical protein